MGSALNACYNIYDVRALAQRRLPRPVFDYAEGAADDEWTARRNIAAFDRLALVPQSLCDVSTIDTSVTVLGERLEWPVIIGPTGQTRLFDPLGETAMAQAAARAGTLYALSALGTTSIEDVAAASTGPKCFQIYNFRDKGLTREFVARASDAGFTSLCLTIDVPLPGNRERDVRNGLSVPLRMTAKGLLDVAMHPRWSWHYLTSPEIKFANITHRIESSGVKALASYVAAQFDPTTTWEDARWLVEAWNGPFAIKSVMGVPDALRAVAVGATAIVVSNHGGRQLDGIPSTIETLPRIVDAVGDKVEVLFDGGIRRGTHVLKALTLGAKACMIGRPSIYGLAAGGEAGVDLVLKILRTELERNMALLGVKSLSELGAEHVRTLDR